MQPSTIAAVWAFCTGAKLIARISAATRMSDRMPPRLSTGSVLSLTCAGTKIHDSTIATTASGTVIKKTDPQ